MADARSEMVDLLSSRTELDSNTCEGKADTVRFNYLYSACLVYEDSGEPYFENGEITYYGAEAQSHTKKQVQNMVARGIKVLSYFIGSGNYSNPDNFKRMYGKDAEFIDTNKVTELARSLNKKFATK